MGEAPLCCMAEFWVWCMAGTALECCSAGCACALLLLLPGSCLACAGVAVGVAAAVFVCCL
jgi:hypothetical protein